MNIIFLGMPMSGKTTIGRIVAEKLQFKFYDSDELIAEEENVSIGAIIEKNGEKYSKKVINQYFLMIRQFAHGKWLVGFYLIF